MDTSSELEQKLSEVPTEDVSVNNILIPLQNDIENIQQLIPFQNDAFIEDARNISDIENIRVNINISIIPEKIPEDSMLQSIEYDSQELQQRGACLDDQSHLHTFENETMMELSRSSWGTEEQFFLQGCKWSPDQTCILTAVNKNGMHIFELPHDLYDMEIASLDRPVDILQSAVSIKENGTIYDYCWYPNMNSLIPASCW